MTKLILKTLSPFYHDRMVPSAPSDFTEMVNMGMRLEERIREGQLVKDSGSSGSSKIYGNGFPQKKEHNSNAISQENHMGSWISNQRHQHVVLVTPVINLAPVVQVALNYQPSFQQRTHQRNNKTMSRDKRNLIQFRCPMRNYILL